MSYIQIAILAIIQGLAELLPVSSSAHVIVAEHLMGLDPSSPEMTWLLVMLHTGTMIAVLIYFWQRWVARFKNRAELMPFLRGIIVATVATGVVGFGLKLFIEKVIFEHMLGHTKGEIENLFRMIPLISVFLLLAGLLIIYSGLKGRSSSQKFTSKNSVLIGIIQGICLPFRGFSRSGATISTALLLGISRDQAEEFSFALAVVLTPAVILLELKRLLHSEGAQAQNFSRMMVPSIVGMFLSLAAGLLALKWLSSWMEKGRWHLFGYYCVIAAILVFASQYI